MVIPAVAHIPGCRTCPGCRTRRRGGAHNRADHPCSARLCDGGERSLVESTSRRSTAPPRALDREKLLNSQTIIHAKFQRIFPKGTDRKKCLWQRSTLARFAHPQISPRSYK